MNLIKTSQLPVVEFMKYVSEGQDNMDEVLDRYKTSIQKNRDYWITKENLRGTVYLPKEPSVDSR